MAKTETYTVKVEPVEGAAKGKFANPNFPTEAAKDEEWRGSIEAVNVGGTRGQFKVRADRYDETDQFYLDPGGVQRINVNGTGAIEFTLYLERWEE